jgi:hypothetical protein
MPAILSGYGILHSWNNLIGVGGKNRTKPKASSAKAYEI